MTQVVSRLFSSHFQALSAAEALRKDGFSDVYVFPGVQRTGEAATGGSDSTGSLVKSMMDAFILKHHAQQYAARIAAGAHLVAVHAIFGTARHAEELMDKLEALPEDISRTPAPDRYVYDERTPLSSSLLLPVLTKTKYPFESFFGLRNITSRPRLFSLFPHLSSSAAPLSGMLGLPTQAKRPTPFSSMIGMSTLTTCSTPFSSLFKLPLLTRD